MALIIDLFFTFRVKYLPCSRSVWDFIVATRCPSGAFFGGIFTGAWNLIVGVTGRLSGGSVAYGANIVGVFSVVAGWFGGVIQGLGML